MSNKTTEWWISIDGKPTGPLSQSELYDLAQRGGVTAQTEVSRDQTVWMKASQLQGIVFANNKPPVFRSPTAHHKPSSSKWLWIVAATVLGGVGLLLGGVILLGVIAASSESVVEPMTVDTANGSVEPAAVARLHFSWSDGTSELTEMVQKLSPQERAALSIQALTTGVDIYAARIYLRNRGNVPLKVFPGNIKIHFGNESVVVDTWDDPRFLQPAIIQPGGSVTGLVTYQAKMEIGAAIRFGNGLMSYNDSTIEVTYD